MAKVIKVKLEGLEEGDDLVSQMDNSCQSIDTEIANYAVVQEQMAGLMSQYDRHIACINSLESLKTGLSSNKLTAQSAALSLESIAANVDAHDVDMVYDTDKAHDTDKLDASIVLEDIQKVEAHASAGIFSYDSGIIMLSSMKFSIYKRAMNSLKKLYAEVEFLVNKAEMGDKPATPYIPTKRYMEKLLYIDHPLNDGIKKVIPDIEKGMREHTKSLEGFVDAVQNWLFNNSHDVFRGKRGVFSELKYDIKDIIGTSFTNYTRSIGYKIPDTDMTFYKGMDLPGGKSVFIQADPNCHDGYTDTKELFRMLNNTKWMLEISDPKAYYPRRVRVFNMMTENALKFALSVIMALPGASGERLQRGLLKAATLVLTAGVYRIVGQFTSPTQIENKTVKIDKEMLLQPIPRSEMISTLKSIEKCIENIDEWKRSVQTYACVNTKKIAAILKTEYDETTINSFYSSNHTHAQQIIKVLIKSGYSSDCGLDIHAIDVCSAMLRYLKDSCFAHPVEEN